MTAQARVESRGTGRAGRRSSGFTLIEVLVVVAIIALLIAILIPSLARAREQARSAQCLSNLSQIGKGIMMYTSESKGYLPGPSHLLLYIGTHVWEQRDEQGKLWAQMNLSYRIGRYLGDRKARNLDQVATCPTVERIPVGSGADQAWYYQLPSHYITNTGANLGKNANYVSISTNVRGHPPYYGTKVPNYFGHINNGAVPHLQSQGFDVIDNNDQGRDRVLPKKIEKIKNAGADWAVADLWYWEASASRGATRRVGTWPFDLKSGESGSITDSQGKLKIPSFPYHMTLNNPDPTLPSNDKNIQSPRLTAGRTNATFFDGHAEGVRQWKGTANPCFDTDGLPGCD